MFDITQRASIKGGGGGVIIIIIKYYNGNRTEWSPIQYVIT